jgi:hypothetical protein
VDIHPGNYISFSSANFNITAVPEPGTYALMAGGAALVAAAAMRRRKSKEVVSREERQE